VKKGKLKRFTAFLLAFAMVMSVMPTTVYASERSEDKSIVTASADGITVTKKAEFVKNEDGSEKKDSNGNPYVKINFDVSVGELKAETQVTGSTDIVLVIDKSLSMTMSGSKKLDNAIDAAQGFVEDVLSIPGATVKVGVVEFSSDAKNTHTLSNDKSSLKDAIGKIRSSGYTFLQKGIYYGQQMLQTGTAQNKIMIVLGDGIPTYRYAFKKKNGSDDKARETFTSASDLYKTYDAYVNFDYTRDSGYLGGGTQDPYWKRLDDDEELAYECTISQAYIARKNIENLNIYSIGYGIDAGKSAEHVFEYIADNGKYSHAKNEDDLAGVIANITEQVTESIKGVTLTDKIPSEMDMVDGSVNTHADIEVAKTVDGITLEWKDQLKANTTYTTTFETILDLSKLNQEQRAQLYKVGQYINTNGDNIVVNGEGKDSSVLSYGENKTIKLDSPQLPLQSVKYDVQYYYDTNGNNTYEEDEIEDTDKTVNNKYVFPGTAEATIDLVDVEKAGYVLENVVVNTTDNEPSFIDNDLAITSDTSIKLQYCKDDNKIIEVRKVWDDADNQDGIRPNEVEFKVMSGDEVVHTGKLSESNDWTAEVAGLNTVDEYTVTELTEVEGYSQVDYDMSDEYETTEDGKRKYICTITNKHVPETTTVNATVTWDDADNQDGKRPGAVTVTLYKIVGEDGDEVEVKNMTISSTDETSKSFENLPVKESGKVITYVVKQVSVSEYTTSEISDDENDNSFIFKNVYVPEKTSITVKKNWLDGGNAEGNRPTSITVQLKKNGTVCGEPVTITGEAGAHTWTHTWTGLDKFSGGVVAEYTVAEINIDNKYTPLYSNDTLTITNFYKKTDETEITVTKNWIDGENVDGLRPASVKVDVLDGNNVVASANVTAANNWVHTFTGLKAYDDEGNKINYSIREANVPSGYTSKVEGYTITNTHVPVKTSVEVSKVWKGDNLVSEHERPNSVTLVLLANGKEVARKDVTGSDTDATWTHTFTGLAKNYLKDGKSAEIIYTVVEEGIVDNYTASYDAEKPLVVTNTYNPVKITKTVRKVWEDDENHDGKRPDAISVNLIGMAGDKKVVDITQSIVGTNNGWQYTFENLNKYYDDGREIVYSVEEVNVPGYTSEVEVDNDGVFVITNTHEILKKDVKVVKEWDDDDNRDGKRPTSIIVALIKNNAEVETVVLNEGNKWTYTWNNQEVYGIVDSKTGELLKNTYEVVEVVAEDVAEDETGYRMTAQETTGNSSETSDVISTITNSYTPERTSVTVNKEWVDNNNQDGYRPDHVTVQLYAGNTACGDAVVLNDGNEWTKTWNDLYAYANGEKITYKVKEVEVPANYRSNAANATVVDENGNFTITNTHTVETTSYTVKKVWNDENNNDGVRPPFVMVQLKANGENYGDPVKLEAPIGNLSSNEWTYTWNVLPKKSGGEDIDYSVEELFVPEGYIDTYSEINTSNATITNTYNVEKISFTVEKDWDDNDDNDGIRPETVEVRLLAGGEPVENSTVILNSNNEWTYTWENLHAMNDGEKIEYSVEELNVQEGYEPSISRLNDGSNGVKLTNTHENDQIELTLVKVWDGGNEASIHASIIVNVYANGELLQAVTLTKEDNWTKTINVDKNFEKENIVYTVDELEAVTGYTLEANDATVSGENGTLTLINKYNVETQDFTIIKEWNDVENQDGIRPIQDGILVTVYRNNQFFANVPLNVKNGWKATLEDLEVARDGKTFTYTVEETVVPEGYSSTASTPVSFGETNTVRIVNTHTPMTTFVKAEKIWQDDNNNDGVRPDSVEVMLLANNEPVDADTLTLSEENNWQDKWDNLPLRKNGKDIEYTVAEVEVKNGYVSDVEYANITESVENEETMPRDILPVDIEGDLEINPVSRHGRLALITNMRKNAKISFTVNKVWNDSNNADRLRPESIEVQLYANGEPIVDSKVTLDEGNKWTHTWEELNGLKNGKVIDYSVKEVNVPSGYTSKVENNANGQTITNTHVVVPVVPTTSVSVLFNWDDFDDIEGARPNGMVVKLFADGVFTNKTLNVTNGTWKAVFDNLKMFNNGNKIKYTVEQAYLPNEGTDNEYTYIGTATDSSKADFVITNKFRPTVDKDITIVWDDEENIDNTRPNEVVVQPLVDGEKYGNEIKITVEDVKDDDNNSWKGKTSKLPKYTEEGKEIVYRVIQSNVEKYTTSYSDDSFTITNKYRRLPLQPEDEDEIVEEDIKNNDNKLSPNKGGNKVNKKPSNTLKNDKTPKTADAYEITKYLWMLLLSAMGLVLLFEANKNKKRA